MTYNIAENKQRYISGQDRAQSHPQFHVRPSESKITAGNYKSHDRFQQRSDRYASQWLLRANLGERRRGRLATGYPHKETHGLGDHGGEDEQ